MTYAPGGEPIDSRFVSAPRDPIAIHRVRRLRALGFGASPDAELDEIAAKIAQVTDAPYSMVNFVLDTQQYFAGLYEESNPAAGVFEVAQAAPTGSVGRTMDLDHSFCPHVVDIKHALVLDDVCVWPRFAGNPVVDKLGIRSYIGAPVFDRHGMVLGTVCAVSNRPSSWGTPGVELIKSMAAEVMELINRRELGAQERG